MTDTANPQTDGPADGKKKKIPTWVWIVAGVLVLGLIGQAFDGDDEESESVTAEETIATPDDESTVEEDAGSESPGDAPAPQNFESIDELESAIQEAIGSETAEGTDRGLRFDFQETAESEEDAGWLLLSYARDEGLSRADVWEETERVFLLARQAESVKSLTLILTAEIVNDLGEESQVTAFVANFDRDTYSRINTDNVTGDLYEKAVTDYNFDNRVRWG
jgi:hypothetical protein